MCILCIFCAGAWPRLDRVGGGEHSLSLSEDGDEYSADTERAGSTSDTQNNINTETGLGIVSAVRLSVTLHCGV